MRQLFITLTSVLLFLSCYKKDSSSLNKPCTNGCTVIKGRALTLNGQPVSDVTVKVWSYRNTSQASGITRYIAETKTASDGSYYLQFALNDNEAGPQSSTAASVYLQYGYNESVYTPASSPSPHDIVLSSPQYYTLTIKEVTLDRDIYLPLKATAKLRLQGFFTTGNDFNSFTVTPTFRMGINNYYLNGITVGASANTPVTEKDVFVAGNDSTKFHIEKWKNGQRQIVDTSIFTPLSQVPSLTFTF